MNTTIASSLKWSCYHCGEHCKDKRLAIDNKFFCCDGCKMVYELLNENNLCAYYHITQNPGIHAKGKFKSENFSYLDDAQVRQKLVSFTNGDTTHVVFYLPQMHCSSCIFLLENLHKINNGIIGAQVNFPKKQVSIFFNEKEITLRGVVELLAFIGYEPFISLNELSDKKKNTESRSYLFKIGIAGFCFGNIMMLSFPDYFSIGTWSIGTLQYLFNYLNLLLSLPVFFYCSSRFFVSAYKGLQQKFLNIDAPIALAILVTFARSVYDIISNTGTGYLDSMSGIVFFMLLGRYFQNKTYDTLSFERDYKSYFPVSVSRFSNQDWESVPVTHLKLGDRILIRNHEIIPADAILFKGYAKIDYSFVTGESKPIEKVLGEIVYAGGKQTGTSIELVVVKEVSQSYLTQLWNNETFKKEKTDEQSFIHRLGKSFSVLLLFLSVGAFIYWVPTDFQKALNAFTAVLIVACPCALLLSATFTNGNVMRIFGRNKFYLRSASVIEKLATANAIVFDKTGTITQSGQAKIIYQGEPLQLHERQWIKAALMHSNHPLSRMLFDEIEITSDFETTYFEEKTGQGIIATVCGNNIRLGSKKLMNNTNNAAINDTRATVVYVSINDKTKGYFTFSNKYRKGLFKLIKELKQKSTLYLLSGDNDSEKEVLKNYFEGETKMLFNQSPHDKLNVIEALQNQKAKVVMIGDGLNDAGALIKSDVGIAVSDNINNFSPACDAILDGSRFEDLTAFFEFSRSAKKIILVSFVISLMYNSIGLTLAVCGLLSPVFAAILMPISSITIVLFTTLTSNIIAWKKGL
jgi:P-type Cu+ transporter